MKASSPLVMGGIVLSLTAFSGGCGHKSLPEAGQHQAAIAAGECGLKNWEWSSEIYEFDGEPEYPDHKGITFTLDASGLGDAGLKNVLDQTDAMEDCLRKKLAAQGVGTNISGGASQTVEVEGEKEHTQAH